MILLDLGQRGQAAHARHALVQDDQVRRLPVEGLERFFAGGGFTHIMAGARQRAAHDEAHVLLVVDDEDVSWHLRFLSCDSGVS